MLPSCFHALFAAAVRAGALATAVMVGQAAELSSEDRRFFEESIRPLLVTNCYECHSEKEGKSKGGLLLDRKAGWVTGGDSGAAVIVPGKPADSLLVRMVRHDPEVEAMPPKSKLSDGEIALLEEWITRGAADPRDEAIGEAIQGDDFDLEARSYWWSLQPLVESPVPAVKDAEWPISDTDRFILAKLEEKGWKPAAPADRASLLRRASVTLTGLAPTVEELETFLKDDGEGAYERQVDRLLASPHFGERFARHWMDVVRYADSKAFENDYTIPYGHEYRDYLIRAFNEDVPYDQFVREAFAGDLLEKPRINPETGVNESVIGAGLMLWTDGHHGPPDLHEDEVRLFDGMINTATVAFKGLTVSCARCHDHKFDAITAADFYSFYGMLRSSRLHYANASALLDPHEAALRELEELKPLLVSKVLESSIPDESLAAVLEKAVALGDDAELVALRKDRNKWGELRAAVIKKVPEGIPAEAVADWYSFLWLDQDMLELNGLRRALIGEATKRGVGKPEPFRMDERFTWTTEGRGFERVEGPEFVIDPSRPGVIKAGLSRGAASGLLAPRLNGVYRTQDFVLDGDWIKLWVKGSNVAVNLIVRNYEMTGYGPTTTVLRANVDSDYLHRIQFPTVLWEGETAYLEVLHHGREMRVVSPRARMTAPSDHAYAVVVDEADFGFFNEYWQGSPEQVAATVRALVVDAAAGKLEGSEAELLGAMFAAGLLKPEAGAKELDELVQHTRGLRDGLPKPRYVRSLVDGTPHDEPVYIRGNHKTLSQEPNPKSYLDVFGGSRIGANGSGRLEYAEHLLSTSDFLTARVRVNRIWSRIFGRGLVASVDDFGKMGEHPSHPELLDHLARRFMEEGWSTKKLIRELVLSRSFRMSSVPGEGVLEVDPNNTFLQHMPLQRMDAESVRDHILHVSGRLDRKLYGPVIDASTADQIRGRAVPHNGPVDGNGRRSVYITMRRNYLPGFLKAFNLPDPGAPVGQRQETNVPAQSLALLNHPFVHQQAEVWAKSLESVADEDERIRRMHLQAFSREADEDEMRWARKVLAEFREEGGEAVAWKTLCHLMINRKEFLYVF